jgi:hypothetical protein
VAKMMTCDNLNYYTIKLRRLKMEETPVMSFTPENLITQYQLEEVIWNTEKKCTEEQKYLAWRRLSDMFKMTVGKLNNSLHL